MAEMSGTIAVMGDNAKKFKLDDGQWYSRNFGAPMFFDPGDQVQFEYERNGKWLNIQGDVVKVGETTPPPQPEKKQWSGGKGGGHSKKRYQEDNWYAYEDKAYQQEINQRITKQNALNNAVALASAGKIEMDALLSTADTFVEWVNGKADGKS